MALSYIKNSIFCLNYVCIRSYIMFRSVFKSEVFRSLEVFKFNKVDNCCSYIKM